MFAKQVSSGYILWKTGPEPIRHSHRERARLLTAPPPGLAKHTGGKFHQAEEYAVVGSMGENRLPRPAPVPKKRLENSAEKAGLFQLVSVPKRFSGIVWKNQAAQAVPAPKGFPGAVQEEADCPRQVCSKETSKK